MKSNNLITIIMVVFPCVFLLPECYESSDQGSLDRKLLLLLLDGFRWDYLKPNLTGFAEIQGMGCRAEYSKPVFPSLSYPNYYTIVTGLFVENHGITLNYMYNPQTKQRFDSNPVWWNQTEPLWITTTKAGMVTDMYHWPGCDVEIGGYKPHYCLPLFREIPIFAVDLEAHLHQVVTKFARNESNVAFVYNEQPDLFGHIAGPDSAEVNLALRILDGILLRFIKKLRLNGLLDKVNVIIVSDHGMTSVKSSVVDKLSIADYVNLDYVDKILDRGVAIGIYPKPGRVDQVVNSLKLMPKTRVWKKEDIPEKFHYKNNVNSPPVLLLADQGAFILGVNDSEKSMASHSFFSSFFRDRSINGAHGYDPDGFPDMRGIFMAFGPDFRKNYSGPAIGNEDVYNLAMSIVGLPPHPNNGTWAKVAHYLA